MSPSERQAVADIEKQEWLESLDYIIHKDGGPERATDLLQTLRLHAAEALVVQFPVWSFGMPAMLKGYFDRMMMPGVAFDLSDPAHAKPLLGNLRRITGITTYGRPWTRALLVGDPPRKMVKRYLPWFADGQVRVDYYALYHMNIASEAKRAAFMEKVHVAMAQF